MIRACLAATAVLLAMPALAAAPVAGRYVTEDGSGVIEIGRCGVVIQRLVDCGRQRFRRGREWRVRTGVSGGTHRDGCNGRNGEGRERGAGR